MEDYVNLQIEKWKIYGCTIMCGGWTGPTKLSIINFMVYCKGSTFFLKSANASDNINDNKYIYGLLKDVIKEVSEANVVQVVTDNGSAFVKAGKLLMKNTIYIGLHVQHIASTLFLKTLVNEKVFSS